MSAAIRNAMFHLASPASPAHKPAGTHQRGSPLATSLVTSSKVAAQNTKSGIVVVSSCIAATYSAQQAADRPAITWPARPARSSRAIAAVSSTIAASPSAGTTRRPISESPLAIADSRAMSATIGGWSTYPSARCCPQARK